MTTKLFKKIIVLFFVLIFCVSPVFAKKAEAQWVVFDPSVFGTTLANQIKEFGGDFLAFTLVNIILERVTASTVNWINNGFNGSPAFVSNPSEYFGNIADGVAGQFIYENPDFQFMCAPFRAKVQIAISKSYLNQGQFQCTLSGVVSNFDNFIGDFNQGGWDGFIELTQNSQNNPIGLYNTWNDQVINNINNEVQNKQSELDWGNGFLSFRKCLARDQTGKCTSEDANLSTPGSVIQDQLNNALHTGNDRLKVADEINEIISALLNQLVSKALGGLASLSKPDPSNNNKTFTSELENGTANDPNIQSKISGATSLINQGDSTISKINNDCYPIDTSGVMNSSCINSVNSGGSGGSGGGNTGFVPITASDNSVIYGPPSDPDCKNASFDDIVRRAGQIFYAGQGGSGQSIANIVQNMDCSPSGALP